nr:tetratricopeptide repeat protein 19, mitochondrial-like [Leptinotarsa decemlineata]
MISLFKTITRLISSPRSTNKRKIQLLYKSLFKFHPSPLCKPALALLCCPVSVASKNLPVTQVSEWDVEENIGHLMTLARIALERGEVEKAEAILEMGIKICEEYQSYMIMPYMYDILASIAFATGNLRRAEILLVNVIEKMVQLGTPESDSLLVDFKLRLTRIYSVHNEDTLAEIGFKNCLDLQKSKILDGDTSTRTGMLYVNCLFWYGLHKIKCSDYNSAKHLIDSAYSFSMKVKGLSPYQEMVILGTLAELNTQLGDYDIALQNIYSAILLGKGIGSLDLPKFYLKLGKIYIKLGADSTAEQWLNEARTLAELFDDKEVIEEVNSILKPTTSQRSFFGFNKN